jgi:hypothetical protein
MKYRITRVSVHQTSKTVALLYLILGVIYIPFMFLINSASAPDEQIPLIVVLLMPVFFCAVGYVMFALISAMYNWVTTLAGGIEVTLSTEGEGP